MNKVFCMNSKCVHYIEDSCEEALSDKTAEIDENGKCALFKEGENEFYHHTSNLIIQQQLYKIGPDCFLNEGTIVRALDIFEQHETVKVAVLNATKNDEYIFWVKISDLQEIESEAE